MLIRTNMWHPAGAARRYQAAGSRTTFNEMWAPYIAHSLHTDRPMSEALQRIIVTLTDEQKLRWLSLI